METLFEVLGFILSLVLIVAMLQLFGIKSRLQRLIDLKEREIGMRETANEAETRAPSSGPRPFGVAG